MTAIIPFVSKVPAEWQVYPGPSMFGSVVVRMPNGYGASILRDPFRNAPEMGVIKFFGPGDDDWHLTYDTPVTDDVAMFGSETEAMGCCSRLQHCDRSPYCTGATVIRPLGVGCVNEVDEAVVDSIIRLRPFRPLRWHAAVAELDAMRELAQAWKRQGKSALLYVVAGVVTLVVVGESQEVM